MKKTNSTKLNIWWEFEDNLGQGRTLRLRITCQCLTNTYNFHSLLHLMRMNGLYTPMVYSAVCKPNPVGCLDSEYLRPLFDDVQGRTSADTISTPARSALTHVQVSLIMHWRCGYGIILPSNSSVCHTTIEYQKTSMRTTNKHTIIILYKPMQVNPGFRAPVSALYCVDILKLCNAVEYNDLHKSYQGCVFYRPAP